MKIFLLLTFIFSTSAIAQMTFEHKSFAVVRKSNGKSQVQSVTLTHLISNQSFDGLYFKVVKGKSDEAISFLDNDPQTLLKASTVYFHLMKARDYFINKLNSEYVKKLDKVVVRIDIINMFHEYAHFAHENKDPQYNNALTIPEGEEYAEYDIKSWGKEIWFRPSKTIHRRDIDMKNGDASMKVLLENFRKQSHMQTLSRFLVGLINKNLFPQGVDVNSVFRTFGSSLMIELGYQTMDELTYLLGRKYFHLDSALVPEIIYHEYSHVALSDHLVLSHSTAVIEGMADIFAGFIGNSSKLALKIKKYNTFSGKNAKRKQAYMTQFETTDYANSDFVFGVLWSLQDVLGDETPEFLYSMRTKLTTNASIRVELIDAILNTCREKCSSPFESRVKILDMLNSKGI